MAVFGPGTTPSQKLTCLIPVTADYGSMRPTGCWQTWRDGALNASVTALIPANFAATYQLRLGFRQRL